MCNSPRCPSDQILPFTLIPLNSVLMNYDSYDLSCKHICVSAVSFCLSPFHTHALALSLSHLEHTRSTNKCTYATSQTLPHTTLSTHPPAQRPLHRTLFLCAKPNIEYIVHLCTMGQCGACGSLD